jgi:hypothetical protein
MARQPQKKAKRRIKRNITSGTRKGV